MFNFFTVSAIVVMLMTTLVSACFAVASRGDGNLGLVNVTETEKNEQVTNRRF